MYEEQCWCDTKDYVEHKEKLELENILFVIWEHF